MDAVLAPVNTHASSHGISGLDPDSYTAHKLKHASPEHIHLTTRRFFIGPIPEGWLNSNRKSWYRRRLELSTYSSKQATFTAAASTQHHRTHTGLDAAARARYSFSFPQPEDADEEAVLPEDAADTDQDNTVAEDEEAVAELRPVSTDIVQPNSDLLPPARTRSKSPARVPRPKTSAQALREEEFIPTAERAGSSPRIIPERRDSTGLSMEVYVTPAQSIRELEYRNLEPSPEIGALSNSVTRTSSMIRPGAGSSDMGSRTRLVPQSPRMPTNPVPTALRPSTREGDRTLSNNDPAPLTSEDNADAHLVKSKHRRNRSEQVRFKVVEAVEDRQRRAAKKAANAANKVGSRIARRQTLQEGTIVKMEKLLVRIDTTMQAVPADYDENGSLKIETQTLEKWKEFMVVARRSRKTDADDFRLQFYNTRVIPELDNEKSSKKPAREIRLIRKSTQVNLFSSLDKSVCIWHPYRKGNRIVIIKAESDARSIEWYTFLRDALGWKRPTSVLVSVPDFDILLRIERPFAGMEAAGLEEDEDKAIQKLEEAQQAVASKIISQSVTMLEKNPDWTSTTHTWHEKHNIGLAWRRYDRLEWVHGLNEQKMYGSMAMQHSYDLELRPKEHYPTTVKTKKGKDFDEPAPIEGFLIRLTSQKGQHKRLGKNFFKKLYFHTHDGYLFFSKPDKVTPPPPPRLQTLSGSNVPTVHEIAEKTPIMYDIDPYSYDHVNQNIKWLSSGIPERINQADRHAQEEARRNLANLTSADGYINLNRVLRITKSITTSPDENDEAFSSDEDNSRVTHIATAEPQTSAPKSAPQNDLAFTLHLSNNLVIHLQSYSSTTRDTWISRLRALTKYWRARTQSDMSTLLSVRSRNLNHLSIDEPTEAYLGAFGAKWELRSAQASPIIHNICPISHCRTITLSGSLYRKTRRHTTFHPINAVLTAGQLLIYQHALRSNSGRHVPSIHNEREDTIDLNGAYVYSGQLVEEELLGRRGAGDSAMRLATGGAGLPRVWVDGWTSQDIDATTCFVVWRNDRRGWFRTAGRTITGRENEDGSNLPGKGEKGRQRAKLKRVRQLGVEGRAMVFKCRSRAERDKWVMALNVEIERLVERQGWEEDEEGGGVRLQSVS